MATNFLKLKKVQIILNKNRKTNETKERKEFELEKNEKGQKTELIVFFKQNKIDKKLVFL